MHNELQRNADWYLARKGMITASKCSTILGKGRTKDQVFSQTAQSYLMELMAQRFMSDDAFLSYNEECNKSNAAMRYGTELESTAIDYYQELTGTQVADVAFTPLFGFEKFAGGSPDGMAEGETLIEVKCPYNPARHLEHLDLTCAEDLKQLRPEYYWQVQMNLQVTDKKVAHFVSYSPFFNNMPMKLLEVPRNDGDITLLLERIQLAVQFMQERITRIINNNKK